MLVFVDKSSLKEHLSQPLQTKHKQYEIAKTFSTGYNGKFNITSSSNNFHSAKYQLLMKMVSNKLLIYQVLMKSKVGILKLKG